MRDNAILIWLTYYCQGFLVAAEHTLNCYCTSGKSFHILRSAGWVRTRVLALGSYSFKSGLHRFLTTQHWTGNQISLTLNCHPLSCKMGMAMPNKEFYCKNKQDNMCQVLSAGLTHSEHQSILVIVKRNLMLLVAQMDNPTAPYTNTVISLMSWFITIWYHPDSLLRLWATLKARKVAYHYVVST